MYKISERDECGNPHEVVYTNGFRVIGKFNDKGEPIVVTIKDPEGKLVYKGTIEEDISFINSTIRETILNQGFFPCYYL